MSVRALILDWGGVIQRTASQAPRQALERELGLAPGALERAVFESVAWHQASVGALAADEAWARITAALGYGGPPLAFITRFFRGDYVDERLLALVTRLRRRGVRVALLSNAPGERRADDDPQGRWGLAGRFDAQVFSYQLGVLKPHPATYAAALRDLGVAADEALFVDDAPANVAGAWQAGLPAVLFVGLRPLVAALARHGLPVDVSVP